MKRLTQLDECGNADIISLSDIMPEIYGNLNFDETNALTDALNRLAAYENAEEQGRLVVLPCKVGTRVYRANKIFGEKSISAEEFEMTRTELLQIAKPILFNTEMVRVGVGN